MPQSWIKVSPELLHQQNALKSIYCFLEEKQGAIPRFERELGTEEAETADYGDYLPHLWYARVKFSDGSAADYYSNREFRWRFTLRPGVRITEYYLSL